MSPARRSWDAKRTSLRLLAAATPLLFFYLVYRFEKFFYDAAGIHNYPLDLGALVRAPEGDLAFADLSARGGFHGAGTAFALAWVAGLTVALFVLFRLSPSGRRRGLYLIGTFGVALGTGAALGFATREDPLSVPALMQPFRHLAGHGVPDALRLPGFITLFGGFTGLAMAVAGVLTVCATLLIWRVTSRPRRRFPEREAVRIAARARDARMLLYAGAGVLVTGVLLTGACHQLPLAYLDEGVREGYQRVADSVRLLTGTIWSFYLVGIYVPASLLIHRRARRLARRTVRPGGPAETRAFLEKIGVAAGPVKGMRELLALLAPLLAGSPALELLGSFIG